MFTDKSTGTAKKTLALAAALASLASTTAFAAPNDYGLGNIFGGHHSSYQSRLANRQQNKNTWRNLGATGAAVAAYGLLNHNSTATVLGAAGAAYSANRYEQDRHSQSQQQNNYRNYRFDRRRY